MTPLVTVCIPTYNRPEMLRHSLQSVLWQSFADVEVIVSDNASTTDTASVIAELDDPRVTLDRLEDNIGLFGNLSRCLRLGTGRYRVMLPDDDLMLPGNLDRKVAFFETHPQVGLVHSGFRFVDADSLPIGKVHNWTGLTKDTLQAGHAYISQSIAHGGITCVSSVMLRSGLVRDEEFSADDGPYCDLALWLRVALRSDIGFLPAGLAGYRVHTGSASSGFQTTRQVNGRQVLTLHHANALRQAHGRFVRRPELSPEQAAELSALLQGSDRRMRLAIIANRWLPQPLLRALKWLMRWGRDNRLYAALSLYSAYAPEPIADAAATGE